MKVKIEKINEEKQRIIFKGIRKDGKDLACDFWNGELEKTIEKLYKTIEYDRRKGLIV